MTRRSALCFLPSLSWRSNQASAVITFPLLCLRVCQTPRLALARGACCWIEHRAGPGSGRRACCSERCFPAVQTALFPHAWKRSLPGEDLGLLLTLWTAAYPNHGELQRPNQQVVAQCLFGVLTHAWPSLS